MPRTYRQLDLDEIRTIFRLLNAKVVVVDIAQELGRHRLTFHSLAQIARRLKHEGACDDTVCHETIYCYVDGPEGQEAGLSAPRSISAIRTAPGRKVRWRMPTAGSGGSCQTGATWAS